MFAKQSIRYLQSLGNGHHWTKHQSKIESTVQSMCPELLQDGGTYLDIKMHLRSKELLHLGDFYLLLKKEHWLTWIAGKQELKINMLTEVWFKRIEGEWWQKWWGERVPEGNGFWKERIIKLVGSSLHICLLQGIGMPVNINNISLLNGSVRKVTQMVDNFE